MPSQTGTNDPDFLLGGDASDFLEGLGGDDVLYGQDGSDTLRGGLGGDYLHGGNGFDYASYFGSTAVIVNLANGTTGGGDAFGDTLVSIEAIIGSQQQDLLIGNAGDNYFEGRGGADVLQGGDGNDVLIGELVAVGDPTNEAANDVLDGGNGDDALYGGDGADQLEGGDGIDSISYSASLGGVTVDLAAQTAQGGDAEGDILSSIENVSGSSTNDELLGSNAANRLDGVSGLDTINGRAGNDTLSGAGELLGGPGNDSITGGTPYFETVTANGGGGRDFIAGGLANDTITGASGSDTISGNIGADRLLGGDGADLFVYSFVNDSAPGASHQDFIVDFRQSEHDRINLENIGRGFFGGDDGPFHFLAKAGFTGHVNELRFVNSANQDASFIQADVDGDRHVDFQVKFAGLIAFTAGDFIL